MTESRLPLWGQTIGGTQAAYGCTTDTCSERFRGFTDEPNFCSVCLEDLTRFEGVTADYMNSVAIAAPRPLPEGDPE